MSRAGVEQVQHSLLDVVRLLQALQSLQPSCYNSRYAGWILPSKLLWDQMAPFVVDSLHVGCRCDMLYGHMLGSHWLHGQSSDK